MGFQVDMEKLAELTARLKQAKDANTGSAEADKKTNDLIDKAEEQFKQADSIVKDIARGFLVECVKLRIGVADHAYGLKAARVQGQLARLNTIQDPNTKMQVATGMIRELDDLLKSLEVIQNLAAEYPDELAVQVANGKALRERIQQLKVQLTAFVGR